MLALPASAAVLGFRRVDDLELGRLPLALPPRLLGRLVPAEEDDAEPPPPA